jgi:adenylate cyclase
LYNALPMSIANELKGNNAVRAQKHQHMAVLFVDIVGFTQFAANRPPDAVVQVLNEIFSEFDTLVDRYPVEKIKTIGDAYMVVGKGNLAAVANLALDMQTSMATYRRQTGFDLSIRSGIHVGPAVSGVIGLKRFLYDVWGDAVNIASRMESLGEGGKIQVSEQVYRELEQTFLLQPRGEIQVKGKGTMRTYFLKARPSGGTILANASSKTPSDRQEYADCAI